MAITPLPSLDRTSPTFKADTDTFFGTQLPTFSVQAEAMRVEVSATAAHVDTVAAGVDAAIAGGAISLDYTFSTTTTNADPGNGMVRLNNATQASATAIYIDNIDRFGVDQTAALALLDDSSSTNKGFLRFTKGGDGTKVLVFAITATTANSGYYTLTGTVATVSTANPFANLDNVETEFSRTGDKGDAGATGATGATGLAGAGAFTGRTAVSSNTTIGSADIGKYFDVTAAVTMTFGSTFIASTTALCRLSAVGAKLTIASADVLVMYPGEVRDFYADGTTVRSKLVADAVGDHCVTLTAGSGFGSTNTKIRVFTTTQTNVGTAFTYATSAANGASVTVNEPGLYSVIYTELDGSGASAEFGISVNSSQLTTNIGSVTAANRLSISSASNGGAAYYSQAVTTPRLAAGDVIRPHSDGAGTGIATSAPNGFFTIRKIGL